mgnify:CR=1 FL=1
MFRSRPFRLGLSFSVATRSCSSIGGLKSGTLSVSRGLTSSNRGRNLFGMTFNVALAMSIIAAPVCLAGYTVEVREPFSYLNGGMPTSFEVGQVVVQRFTIGDLPDVAPSWGNQTFWDGGIVEYSLNVPGAGFSFLGGSGNVVLNNDGSLSLYGNFVEPVTFEGREFIRGAATFVPEGNPAISEIATAAEFATQFKYRSFELIFQDLEGQQTSGTTISGVVNSNGDLGDFLPSIPEPSTYGFIVGLLAVGFAFLRRR